MSSIPEKVLKAVVEKPQRFKPLAEYVRDVLKNEYPTEATKGAMKEKSKEIIGDKTFLNHYRQAKKLYDDRVEAGKCNFVFETVASSELVEITVKEYMRLYDEATGFFSVKECLLDCLKKLYPNEIPNNAQYDAIENVNIEGAKVSSFLLSAFRAVTKKKKERESAAAAESVVTRQEEESSQAPRNDKSAAAEELSGIESSERPQNVEEPGSLELSSKRPSVEEPSSAGNDRLATVALVETTTGLDDSTPSPTLGTSSQNAQSPPRESLASFQCYQDDDQLESSVPSSVQGLDRVESPVPTYDSTPDSRSTSASIRETAENTICAGDVIEFTKHMTDEPQRATVLGIDPDEMWPLVLSPCGGAGIENGHYVRRIGRFKSLGNNDGIVHRNEYPRHGMLRLNGFQLVEDNVALDLLRLRSLIEAGMQFIRDLEIGGIENVQSEYQSPVDGSSTEVVATGDAHGEGPFTGTILNTTEGYCEDENTEPNGVLLPPTPLANRSYIEVPRSAMKKPENGSRLSGNSRKDDPRLTKKVHFSDSPADDLVIPASTGLSRLVKRKSSIAAARLRASLGGTTPLPSAGTMSIKRHSTSMNEGLAHDVQSPIDIVSSDSKLLVTVFSFLSEQELLRYATSVCKSWSDAATVAHASLMLASLGFSSSLADPGSHNEDEEELREVDEALVQSVASSMERPWKHLMSQFPWACYLSEGAFKKVFKVYSLVSRKYEALSVMNVDGIDKTAVAAELALSSMLASLVRRNICPNFIIIRGVFTCPYEPPASSWGSEENKKPRGGSFDPRHPLAGRKPREPGASKRGTFQYIRMELCRHGDAEEYIKRLPDEALSFDDSRSILFQTAFALHVAADRFSMKHYDVKLLNIFLQDAVRGDVVHATADVTVLRYGLGDRKFALRMPSDHALMAKLADYGTANVQAATNGKPVTIRQFTTIENTPPEFLIEGDYAVQGHGHDNFGLGLCMLHLFTGHAPYEEIMEDVLCPPALKEKLRQIWEEDENSRFNILRKVIHLDVDYNDGEPDETLYHTIYRYLVLLGIPEDCSQTTKQGKKVWKAIVQSLEGVSDGAHRRGRPVRKTTRGKNGPDSAQFESDRKKYSLSHGDNVYIARARKSLEMHEGGMELLMSLVNFDAAQRATPLDVMNSNFMSSLQESPGEFDNDVPGVNVLSFMAYHQIKGETDCADSNHAQSLSFVDSGRSCKSSFLLSDANDVNGEQPFSGVSETVLPDNVGTRTSDSGAIPHSNHADGLRPNKTGDRDSSGTLLPKDGDSNRVGRSSLLAPVETVDSVDKIQEADDMSIESGVHGVSKGVALSTRSSNADSLDRATDMNKKRSNDDIDYNQYRHKEGRVALKDLQAQAGKVERDSCSPETRDLLRDLSTKGHVEHLPTQSYRLKKGNIQLGSSTVVVKRDLGSGSNGNVVLVESEAGSDAVPVNIAVKVQGNECKGIERLGMEYEILRKVEKRVGPHYKETLFPFPRAISFYSAKNGGLLGMTNGSTTGINLVNLVNEYQDVGERAIPELIAAHYVVLMLKTLEDLHVHGKILHCDTKPDNWILSPCQLESPHDAGLMLVDFGQAVDLEAAAGPGVGVSEVRFNGNDVVGSETMKCIAMREGLSWSYDIDTFGLCASAHVLLFGTHIEVEKDPSSSGRWKLREGVKRYWRKHIWDVLFDTLLNLGGSKPERLAELRYKFEHYTNEKSDELKRLLGGQARILMKKH